MLRSLTPALAAISALAAAPASAQTPTLDGAMRFMELALPGHLYGCASACDHKSYTIQTIARTEPCVIKITGTSPHYPPITAQIDFTRVAQVQDGGGGAALLTIPGGQALLIVGSTEFGARLIYAANFARLKCDRTTSTGF